MPRMNPIVLATAALFGLGGLAALGAVVFFVGNAWFGLPVGAQGPDQPIAFPHTVHAGSMEQGGIGLDCTFCHRNADKGPAATIPTVQQCMFCHAQVKGVLPTAQAQISILSEASKAGQAIDWLRVHRLPDHVQFVHDVHIRFLMANPGNIVNASAALSLLADGTVSAAQTCSTCHGAVETMVKVNQVRALKMGDCVDCHRQYNAPTDCAICHY